MSAATNIVTLESMIVAKARALNPASRAEMTERPVRLLTDAFVDQDVGINRHADGEDDAGDAGQSQRRSSSTIEAKMSRICTANARSAKMPNMP